MRANATLAAVAAAAAIATATATAGPSACGPEQVGGTTVRTWCGPAKATVKWAGRTLTVKGGLCEITKLDSDALFTINVGRYTVPPAKPKATSFSAGYGPSGPLKAGTTAAGWLISFQTPGKQYLLRSMTAKVKVLKAGAKRVTFSGQLDTGGKVTGSWTC